MVWKHTRNRVVRGVRGVVVLFMQGKKLNEGIIHWIKGSLKTCRVSVIPQNTMTLRVVVIMKHSLQMNIKWPYKWLFIENYALKSNETKAL